MTNYDKPFMDYNDMISLLRSRGMVIDDEEFAKKTLSNTSYYTLINGNKSAFLKMPNSDNFIPGTTFEALYTLHNVEKSLNHILLKYILSVETSLKSRIAYIVAKNYGVFSNQSDSTNRDPGDYLYRDNYRNCVKRNNVLHKIKDRLINESKHKSLSYYREEHNHIPPWILAQALSFGKMISWYSILKGSDKDYVCDQYITDLSISSILRKDFLIKALELIRAYRNYIAHGKHTKYLEADLPNKNTMVHLSGGIIKSADAYENLLAVIASLFILIDDPYLLFSFYAELHGLLRDYLKGDVLINGMVLSDILKIPQDILSRIKLYVEFYRE